MILETQEQLRSTPHKVGVSFRCADCGTVKEVKTSGGTGYGYDSKDMPVCYVCCGNRDGVEMQKTGKAILYLSIDPTCYSGKPRQRSGHYYGNHKIANWPGTLSFSCNVVKIGSHNMAGRRFDVWFRAFGSEWHGVQYGDNTQILHCKQIKGK